MSDPRPFPEQREEPWVLTDKKNPNAPAQVLGDRAYATVECPCDQSVHTLYYTADDVTHTYCSSCDHMHLFPEAIKKRRFS
jgi:hypothetical protein